MSNEQQIHNLIARYTHYVDQARFDKVGDLFANGKIISPGNVMEGKEGVVSQLSKNLQVYTDGTLIITLAGDLSHHAAPNTIDPQTIENRGK